MIPVQAEGLTGAERKIVSRVEPHHAAALALLEQVVNVNSGTMNLEGVRKVGRIFQEELERIHFQTRWIDGAGFKRAGHLVAEHPGPGPRILLLGHLDTVFEADSPFQTYQKHEGNEAGGPGIIDMKGGDVIQLLALWALEDAGLLKSLNLVVVMTGDEEEPGRPLTESRAALREEAKGTDYALGFEDGDMDPAHAIVARRGSTSWRIRVKGTTAHSSQIFREDIGDGAILETARILDGFRLQLAGEKYLTFSPGAILGGTSVELDAAAGRGTATGKSNVVAGEAMVSGDLRALTPQQFEGAMSRMRSIVEASLPHTESRIEFDEGYPPLAPTQGNERLLFLFDQASRDLGSGPVTATDPGKAGAADVAYLAGQVPMILDGIGLKGRDDHSPGEKADLTTLPLQARRAALLIYRLSRTTR
jgi:glutamate carboxypeptidase